MHERVASPRGVMSGLSTQRWHVDILLDSQWPKASDDIPKPVTPILFSNKRFLLLVRKTDCWLVLTLRGDKLLAQRIAEDVIVGDAGTTVVPWAALPDGRLIIRNQVLAYRTGRWRRHSEILIADPSYLLLDQLCGLVAISRSTPGDYLALQAFRPDLTPAVLSVLPLSWPGFVGKAEVDFQRGLALDASWRLCFAVARTGADGLEQGWEVVRSGRMPSASCELLFPLRDCAPAFVHSLAAVQVGGTQLLAIVAETLFHEIRPCPVLGIGTCWHLVLLADDGTLLLRLSEEELQCCPIRRVTPVDEKVQRPPGQLAFTHVPWISAAGKLFCFEPTLGMLEVHIIDRDRESSDSSSSSSSDEAGVDSRSPQSELQNQWQTAAVGRRWAVEGTSADSLGNGKIAQLAVGFAVVAAIGMVMVTAWFIYLETIVHYKDRIERLSGYLKECTKECGPSWQKLLFNGEAEIDEMDFGSQRALPHLSEAGEL